MTNLATPPVFARGVFVDAEVVTYHFTSSRIRIGPDAFERNIATPALRAAHHPQLGRGGSIGVPLLSALGTHVTARGSGQR